MVNPVNLPGSILEVLRRQMAKRETSGAKSSGQVRSAETTVSTIPVDIVTRRKQAKGYLEALDPQDPSYFRKARALFLQLVLADEFGETISNEAAFPELVESVERLLDEEPQLNQAFEELFKRLRG